MCVKEGSQTTWCDKKRRVGSPKMSTFCQQLYGRKCQRRRIGGQKKDKNMFKAKDNVNATSYKLN